jgi:hypothetical protein
MRNKAGRQLMEKNREIAEAQANALHEERVSATYRTDKKAPMLSTVQLETVSKPPAEDPKK